LQYIQPRFSQTWQKICGLDSERDRQAQQSLYPDLPAILFDQVDLRPVKARDCRQPLLRQAQRGAALPNTLADESHKVVDVHSVWS